MVKCIRNKERKKRELEIYIHIPFCVKKCAYCDFLSGPAGKAEQKAYVEALQKEIASFGGMEVMSSEGANAGNCKGQEGGKLPEYMVVSVFFGGGTPSILNADWIGKILTLLKKRFEFREDVEITIECNPGTADRKKLKAYREYGINRISFGLQSADNEELQLLGRIHTWEQFLEIYQEARAAGFSNINVDLMSSLPGQSRASWKKTLEKVLALEPEHISAYSLIIEEGTPFYEKYEEDARLREEGEVPKYLPSEEEEREMYRLTEEMLLGAGMHRYEISNYAKEGYECRHNIGYWIGTEYVGFGLGASSYLRKTEQEQTAERGSKISENCEGKIRENLSVFGDWKDGIQNTGEKIEAVEGTTMTRVQNTQDMQKYLAADFSWQKKGKGLKDSSCRKEGACQEKLSYQEERDSQEYLHCRNQGNCSEDLSGRETEILSVEDQMAEFMFLGLRMMRGVSEAEFEQRFGQEIDAVYGAVMETQCDLGLLEREDGRIRLTPRGIDLSNRVMAEFLL